MGRASPALSAFNGGEFSPTMEGRVEIDKYAIAAHIQQNFLPLKQGPAMFRPGTVYTQPVKNSANRTWLQRFEYSQTQAFLVEFGGGYCRFYTDHGPLLTTGNAAYNGATAYVVGNQVVSGGITYLCIAATTGNAPPNATYWYAMTPYQGSTTTAIYEIPSPYAAADLTDSLGEFALQIVQSGDVLYIAGGYAGAGPAGQGYPPYTLTRVSNSPPQWTFAVYAPIDGPFSSPLPVVPNQNIALTVSASQGVGITINAYGGNVFAATDVGRLVRIASQWFNAVPWQTGWAYAQNTIVTYNGNNYIALGDATSGPSPPVVTSGAQRDGANGVLWLYMDSGYGIAQITQYVSPTQVVANTLVNFPANVVGATAAITGVSNASTAVVSASQSFAANTACFVTGVQGMPQINNNWYVNTVASGSGVTLGGVNSTTWGVYTGGGTIIENASTEWQLGAWSNTTEWPRAVAFFKDRLFWAGKHNAWGSVPGNYNSHAQDFNNVVTTDAAINILISGADASDVCWMTEAIILLIGTEGGEYGLDAANYSSSPLGPANVEVLRQSQWRSRHTAPVLVGSSVLYVQRAGRKVFAMDYNFYLNRYDSTDQSKFSYHITIGGIVQIAMQQEPFSVLWAVREDGTLLSYTYNREDNVTAWARHNLGGGGLVESIAVIPAPDGTRDELWMVVNRTVGGVTVRTVEYMAKHFEGPQGGYAGDAQASAWYVDCGVQSVATPVAGATTTTITGLPAVLIGQTVAILADGGPITSQVVPSSGSLTLTGAFTTVTVGLPYQGNLVPMRPEGGADVGTAQGKVKQGANLVLRLVDTAGGQVGQLSTIANPPAGTYQNPLGLTTLSCSNFEPIQLNDPVIDLGVAPQIFSGDVPISFPHAALTDQDARDLYILVQQNLPLPMTVAGLFPNYEVEEPR